jgi:hypothetical protein
MFEDPTGYGCVPYGCTDQEQIRAAHEAIVRADLSAGWDRELVKTEEGRARLEQIVKAAVEARMRGEDLGAAPFLVCLMAD